MTYISGAFMVVIFIAILLYAAYPKGSYYLTFGTTTPILFSFIILGIYAWQFWKINRIRNGYDREIEELKSCVDSLGSLVRSEKEIASNSILDKNSDTISAPAQVVKSALSDKPVPLLASRLVETIRMVRRGSPLESADMSIGDELILAPPERSLRAAMDTVLNLGIAGTFLSIILTMFSRSASAITSETLLDHIGPGLISGLVGVWTNVCLRMLHGELLSAQEWLTEEVDTCISDYFILKLGKKITCPEERMVTIIWSRLQKQTQSILGEVTKDLIDPVKSISISAGDIARYSGTWAEVASDLKNAYLGFIKNEEIVNQKHEKQLDELFRSQEVSLSDFLSKLESEQKQLRTETEKYLNASIQNFTLALNAAHNQMQGKLNDLIQQQANITSQLLSKNMDLLGNEVTKRVGGIEEQVAQTLQIFSRELPLKMQNGIEAGLQAALKEIVQITRELQDETGKLGLRIDQLNQSQLQITGNLAKISDQQTKIFDSQDGALEEWRKIASESLDSISESFEKAAQSLSELHNLLQGMKTPIQEANDIIRLLHTDEAKLEEALHLSRQSINLQSDCMRENAAEISSLGDKMKQVSDSFLKFDETLQQMTSKISAINPEKILSDEIPSLGDKMKQVSDSFLKFDETLQQMTSKISAINPEKIVLDGAGNGKAIASSPDHMQSVSDGEEGAKE